MRKYNRCKCGRLYKPYRVTDKLYADIDEWICLKCNKELDDEYKKQQETDKFVKSLKIDEVK